mmetsp:Transcript_81673/g.221609  ORF Transcript_81673/g.221609 Transcript_81673/m.221609 type:complete len:236 (-) Transcript_81673:240-947(-)
MVRLKAHPAQLIADRICGGKVFVSLRLNPTVQLRLSPIIGDLLHPRLRRMRRRRRPGRSPTGCATATPRILVSKPSGVWVDAQCPQLLSEGVGGGPVLTPLRLDPAVELRLQHRAVLRPLPRASSSSPRGRCQRGQPGGRCRHRHVRQVGFGLEGRPARLLSAMGLLHHHRLHGRVPVRRSGGVGVDAHAPQLAAEGVRGGEVLAALGLDPLIQLVLCLLVVHGGGHGLMAQRTC